MTHTEWLALPRCGTADVQLGDERIYDWGEGVAIKVTVLHFDENTVGLAYKSYVDEGIMYPGGVFTTDYSNLGVTLAEYKKIKEIWSLDEPC